MNTKDKNFKVVDSCRSCKFFVNNSSYFGKRKNGYCYQGTNGELPPENKGSTFDMFIDVWDGIDKSTFVTKYKDSVGYWKRSDKWVESSLISTYDNLAKTVNWWKENKDKVHTCHIENTCDFFEVGKRRNSNATGHVKRNGKIKWLEELE